jgi:hypothetical protein
MQSACTGMVSAPCPTPADSFQSLSLGPTPRCGPTSPIRQRSTPWQRGTTVSERSMTVSSRRLASVSRRSRPPRECPFVSNNSHPRFISVRECLAMVELGADHITIGRLVLEDLCMGWGLPKFQPGLWKVPVSEQLSKSGFEWEAWAAHDTAETAKRMAAVAETDPMSSIVDKDWLIASAKIDYLAPGVLSKFNEDDPITRDRLKCGLARFSVFEGKSKTYIEEVRAGLA